MELQLLIKIIISITSYTISVVTLSCQEIRHREENLLPSSPPIPSHSPDTDPRQIWQKGAQVLFGESVQVLTTLSRATGGTEMSSEGARESI